MANNCYNLVRIEKHAEIENAFKKYGKSKNGMMEFFVGIPAEINSNGWYSKHWGAKDVPFEYVNVMNTNSQIEIVFDTRWTPPIYFLE